MRCFPEGTTQEDVIKKKAASSSYMLGLLAGDTSSLDWGTDRQLLFESTPQPKGQLCEPSVSKCIRISGSAELSSAGIP